MCTTAWVKSLLRLSICFCIHGVVFPCGQRFVLSGVTRTSQPACAPCCFECEIRFLALVAAREVSWRALVVACRHGRGTFGVRVEASGSASNGAYVVRLRDWLVFCCRRSLVVRTCVCQCLCPNPELSHTTDHRAAQTVSPGYSAVDCGLSDFLFTGFLFTSASDAATSKLYQGIRFHGTLALRFRLQQFRFLSCVNPAKCAGRGCRKHECLCTRAHAALS